MSTFKILVAILLFSTQPCFGVDTDEYHRTMAKHYFEEKNYVEAKKSIEHVLNSTPDDKEFLSLRTQVVGHIARLKALREAEAQKKKEQALKAAEIRDSEQRANLLQAAKAREKQNQLEAREAPIRRAKFLNSAICDCEGLRAYALESIEREKNVGNISGVVDKVKLHGLGTTVERCSRAIDAAKRELSASGSTETVCSPAKAISRGLGQDCMKYRTELAQKQ